VETPDLFYFFKLAHPGVDGKTPERQLTGQRKSWII
jgi:hypothetical protein